MIDSVRFEAMRDGIADYELFCQLAERAERHEAAAERLVARHVLDFDRYDCDVKTFRDTRREMLKWSLRRQDDPRERQLLHGSPKLLAARR
ncbi:MAG TPA: hypothetical protein VGR35_13030 [Tepidisphaeraceae bacterium]|nr:hypothetical protein [Tepidisphaeraceae bacterium]